MLVLAFKIGERILVQDVWVKAEEIRGNTIRLSFDAPRDKRVIRESALLKNDKPRSVSGTTCAAPSCGRGSAF